MEKSLKNYLEVGRVYDERSIRELSPLSLAYIGDGVFELLVRTHILQQNLNPATLHRKSIRFVKAKAQRELIGKVKDQLTKEELAVLRRGRNAKSNTMPKNADVTDYRAATGFEALFGYLYLLGREQRLLEIFMKMVEDEQES